MHGSSNFPGQGHFQDPGDRGYNAAFEGDFARGFGRTFSRGPGAQMWEALDQLRGAFERRGTPRMGRGDVRAAVLALLAEKPMHGYQIIQEIEVRSSGAWKPSPGSVYPTLQLLSDEGLIEASEADGRKTYTLTESGRTLYTAESGGGARAPWTAAEERSGAGVGALSKAGFELAQAVAQVGRSGTGAQVQEAISVLSDARRKLYAILAQD